LSVPHRKKSEMKDFNSYKMYQINVQQGILFFGFVHFHYCILTFFLFLWTHQVILSESANWLWYWKLLVSLMLGKVLTYIIISWTARPIGIAVILAKLFGTSFITAIIPYVKDDTL
jgi:hypothetical protein